MIPLPTRSPFSGGEIIVTRFYCPDTDVTVEGRFSVSAPFAQLTPEQLQFIEIFVRNEGRISRMEGELSMSYPTIRNRLREIIRAMGYEPGQEEEEPTVAPVDRSRVLQDLDQGKLSFEEAMRILQGEEA
ncbi:MAG: DUF2089 domain-containing protein [Caldilineaceae bacterium]|nr:DUF2089 domain-containing protein [Caldilineaceae bacterium]MCB9152221.1 DUF2089 domain-containing protein [Caldilineaceae bacterium]